MVSVVCAVITCQRYEIPLEDLVSITGQEIQSNTDAVDAAELLDERDIAPFYQEGECIDAIWTAEVAWPDRGQLSLL